MKPSKTILLVEDEEPIRRLASTILKRTGYRVLEACDGAEAAKLWRAEGESIDLLFTDVIMPNLGGPELAQELVAARPDLKVVFTTGSNQLVIDKTMKSIEHKRFLQKPYTPSQLKETIAATLFEE